MSITLTHTRPAPAPSSAPHQTPELEPAGLADLSRAPVTTEALDILDVLEAEAILVIREIAAECRRPVLLFSGGKDSVVMLHLARKAFWPAPIPFPVLHVDTGHNFPEVLAYRDRTVEELGLRLVVARVQDYIDDGRLRERTDGTRNPLQTIPLLDAIEEGGFDGVFGGGRRDEEKARAKERIVSLRDEFGQQLGQVGVAQVGQDRDGQAGPLGAGRGPGAVGSVAGRGIPLSVHRSPPGRLPVLARARRYYQGSGPRATGPSEERTPPWAPRPASADRRATTPPACAQLGRAPV